MSKIMKYVGLDVHKNSIAIAISDQKRHSEVRYYGQIENNMDKLNKVFRKLVSDGSEICCVYEADPRGYYLYRYLTGIEIDCSVIAPSQMPRKSVDRVKTDRRDAVAAELGDLRRFANPAQMMAYLGFVPSEHSSGEKTKRGGITKTGNGHARKALIEAAQAYRLPARKSRERDHGQENPRRHYVNRLMPKLTTLD